MHGAAERLAAERGVGPGGGERGVDRIERYVDGGRARRRRIAGVEVEEELGFERVLDPKEGMKSREIPGGTGPEAVAAALAEARERLTEMTL